jgi:sec-independent protein translocase protein TatA
MIYLYDAFDIPTLILLIFILLILFGSRKVPEIAKSFGEAVREFRKAMSETDIQPKQNTQPILQQSTIQQKQYDDPLIEAARRKGVSVEGKTRLQIVEELAKKIKEES